MRKSATIEKPTMSRSTADAVRRAAIGCLRGEQSINEMNAMDEATGEKPDHETLAARMVSRHAVNAQRLSRRQLAETIREFAGHGPVAIMVDGAIVTLTDDVDGLAIVEQDRVLTL
jgi:hypothetical protein